MLKLNEHFQFMTSAMQLQIRKHSLWLSINGWLRLLNTNLLNAGVTHIPCTVHGKFIQTDFQSCPLAQSFCCDHTNIRAHNTFMVNYECVSRTCASVDVVIFNLFAPRFGLTFSNIFPHPIRICPQNYFRKWTMVDLGEGERSCIKTA